MFDKKLAKKILGMVKLDQKVRKAKKFDLKKMGRIDRRHTAEMKKIVKKYGWPGKNLVGEKGADGAWLLVQHADHDLEFQKKCLKLIREAVKKGDAQKQRIAYLIDRILTHQKKKQIYGTQFRIGKKSNKLSPFPITDQKNLNKRRKNMGLEPFQDYKKSVLKLFKR